VSYHADALRAPKAYRPDGHHRRVTRTKKAAFERRRLAADQKHIATDDANTCSTPMPGGVLARKGHAARWEIEAKRKLYADLQLTARIRAATVRCRSPTTPYYRIADALAQLASYRFLELSTVTPGISRVSPGGQGECSRYARGHPDAARSTAIARLSSGSALQLQRCGPRALLPLHTD